MNLQNIFSEIEKVDPEVYERMDTRRDAMKGFAKFTGKAALAAMPLALASMFNKAYGQTPANVITTLQFALTLEYLEAEFYTLGVASPAVTGNAAVSAPALAALQKIRDDENKHVVYLKSVLTALGTTPIVKPTFDFTAGSTTTNPAPNNGPFIGWNANYDIFLAVAQTLEDTGVRAYKGSAGTLVSNPAVLTAALNVHSVEARHASHIRQMRRARALVSGAYTAAYFGNIKPWIEGNESNIGGLNPINGKDFRASVQPNYSGVPNGEDNLVQLGITVTSLPGITGGVAAATAAFDEPLDQAYVGNPNGGLVDGFITP